MKYLLDAPSLQKLATEVFGEERIWVDVGREEFYNDDYDEDDEDSEEYFYRDCIKVYVYFPKVVIKNSKGQEHTIYDLYTRFLVSDINEHDYKKCDIEFQGYRSSYTLKELRHGYIHSHLCNGSREFSNFCTGGGDSQFTIILNELMLQPTEDNWLLVLMSLENFVSWESVEGGPYFRMEGLTLENSSSVSEQALVTELTRMIPFLGKEVWEFTDKLSLIENHPHLYDVFNHHSGIRKLRGSNNPSDLNQYRDSIAGRYLEWKGRKIPLTVMEEEMEPEVPQISMAVVENYIRLLKEYAFKYTNTLSYKHAKDKWHAKTIAKAGIFQYPHTHHYREAAKADRLSPQYSWA
jgi:hypothetical protein